MVGCFLHQLNKHNFPHLSNIYTYIYNPIALSILLDPLLALLQKQFKDSQWKQVLMQHTHFEFAPAHEATVSAAFPALLAPQPLAH